MERTLELDLEPAEYLKRTRTALNLLHSGEPFAIAAIRGTLYRPKVIDVSMYREGDTETTKVTFSDRSVTYLKCKRSN